MSDQSQTTANPSSEPVLCKMACGFFGNQATGGCCSKCWREQQKKNGVDKVESEMQKTQPPTPISEPMMEVDKEPVVSPSKTEEPKNDSEKSETVVKKTKKKKKKSYKNLMAGMMNSPPTKDDNKDEKEKEALRKVTGGGAFSKIDKI